MLEKDEVMINGFAQERNDFEEVLSWFESLDSREKLIAIHSAKFFLYQCHPTKETIEKAFKLIPLKETATPIVLLKTKKIEEALDKISSLPENEYRNSFITLISIFKLADSIRRETFCKNGCSHEWHNMS